MSSFHFHHITIANTTRGGKTNLILKRDNQKSQIGSPSSSPSLTSSLSVSFPCGGDCFTPIETSPLFPSLRNGIHCSFQKSGPFVKKSECPKPSKYRSVTLGMRNPYVPVCPYPLVTLFASAGQISL